MLRARQVSWFIIGMVAALAVHYSLYRITLPIQPFIYQAF